jgi:glycosyltransferase involved in cell wall biosynthesis
MKYEGVNQMLYSACELEKEGLPIKFVFVGSGEEKENMQKFVKENGIKNVYIGGRIQKEAIPALLKQSNVCLAYLHELEYPEMFKYGMSKNKINEYLYSGAVTIMGFADSRNEITDSNGGYTFEPENNRFAELIKKVYRMKEDERRQFGENARRYMNKTHDIKVLAKKYIDEIFV